MQLVANAKKITVQHRAFYCYIALSLWLLVLLIVMYKYMETEDNSLFSMKNTVENHRKKIFLNTVHPDFHTQRVLRMCNLPQNIGIIGEGLVDSSFKLEGVLILLRHGDRGPLTHVKHMSTIDCTAQDQSNFADYEAYMENITGSPLLSQILGQFHGFPVLPQKHCSIGQLTQVGVSQLLKTGRILRAVYANKLYLHNSSVQEDFIVYSTKYRRTLQSALAFLYSFLTSDLLHNVIIKEIPSLQFCFEDCACPASDIYMKKFNIEKSKHLNLHPAVLKLLNFASLIVYEVLEKYQSVDPYMLRDALMTYVCHGAGLPCSEDKSLPSSCIHMEEVSSLISYIEWETRKYARSNSLKRACILRAYGLIRNIVSHLIRIVSEKKPKFVLYSGHDKTILYLATALGIATDTTYLAHYASRFIIEVYRRLNKTTTEYINVPVGDDYYFRVLFNGKDLTNQLRFCKDIPNVILYKFKEISPVILCPIHTFIQFLHNDFFLSFNASNFKDACFLR